ncbi:NADPH:quinone oxidoreductase family protein [Glycomyces terrestris]|uniref:NADPH:quinone oxidoreductase family protein n=2 Tax=Glycomyces terrestris TaxID=2493553 RepID=A0A426URS5_9ACTN|nr:NADPH:quinone oxidoreductase family protein [Glycomyces terrestris]
MRAWRVFSHGEPSVVMALAPVPVPEPAPGEVLIRTRAVAVNFPDVLLARGMYQERPPIPFTPGIELCGEVAALGDGVDSVAVGQRVVATAIGVMAEYAAVPAWSVHSAPDSLDDAAASAFLIAYQTAWFGLHQRAALQSGETLLVNAAAGGVGTAACQLGAAAGATVIGIVGSSAKAPAAEAAGADRVLLRGEDWVAAVKAAGGADVVFDPVGGPSFAGAAKAVNFEGRIVVVGFASGEVPPVRADHALVKNYSVLGLHWALYQRKRPELVAEAHTALTRLADEGVIRPAVAETVPFEDAADAVQRLADGETTGRIVVVVGE